MQRRLAAILAADVVGYSKLMAEDEAGTLAALRDHRENLFDPEITRRGGRIVKLMGDGTLVEFPSVVDAAEAGLAIQQALAGKQGAIRLRIGIHLGDVIIDGDDIYGDGVNIAARLEALAEPGGICVSSIVHESLGNRIEATFADAGRHEVKNIDRPIHVFKWPNAQQNPKAKRAESKAADKRSIAVLPLDVLSDDPDQQYLADGIVEDIITELSRFKEMLVIARNSTFAYKGKSINISEVANDLGVRYVLEGSIRRGGNRVRIVVQLIDSDTGSHVWAEKYDRDLEDIFALQEEITRCIVAAIEPQIEIAETQRSRKLTGDALTSYEQSMRAMARVHESVEVGDPELLASSLSEAAEALARDELNGHALWALTWGHAMRHLYRWGDDPDGDIVRAREFADRFVATDSNDFRAYIMRGWAHGFGGQHDAALADYERAQALNPSSAKVLFNLAWGKAVAGRHTEAKEHAHMALRLSPYDHTWIGEAYLALTLSWFVELDFEEARTWALKAIQMAGSAPIRRAIMVAASGHLGDLEPARIHLENLRTRAPNFLPDVMSGRLKVYKQPEHNALLIEGLKQAGVNDA